MADSNPDPNAVQQSERYILLLHGLGGDRQTMLPISDYCARQLPGANFGYVEGPINLGDPGRPCRGWFEPPQDHDRALDGPNPPRLDGLRTSVALMHNTIDELVERGMKPSKIHLLGHSQGGAITIATGLTYPARLGSVCTIAGYLAMTRDVFPVSMGTPFLLHHSQHDNNVSFRWALYAKAYIEGTGSCCTIYPWDIRDSPHSVHREQLDAICASIAASD